MFKKVMLLAAATSALVVVSLASASAITITRLQSAVVHDVDEVS